MSTITFNKGDRVKATNTNGDTAEFTVGYADGLYVDSETNSYATTDGWSFELLKRALPPLPTAVGTVIRITKWASTPKRNYVALRTVGGWRISVDSSIHYTDERFEHHIERGSMEFEVIYEPEANR